MRFVALQDTDHRRALESELGMSGLEDLGGGDDDGDAESRDSDGGDGPGSARNGVSALGSSRAESTDDDQGGTPGAVREVEEEMKAILEGGDM